MSVLHDAISIFSNHCELNPVSASEIAVLTFAASVASEVSKASVPSSSFTGSMH